MKKIILLSVFILSFSVKAQNYTFSQITATYVDLTGTTSLNNGEIWDDPEYILVLPFPFFINGASMNSINVSDGYITQNATTPIIQTLAPFAMDLLDRGDNGTTSLSPISYKTEGTVGNRILKIEYKNCGSFYDANLAMFINFQVWLYETTNVIEYHYGQSSISNLTVFYDGDTGAYIGFGGSDENENISNAHFLTGSATNPTLSTSLNLLPITGTPPANTVYRFTPTTLSNASIQKSIVSIYPNPFNNLLNIEGLETGYTYSIYDLQGKIIQKNDELSSSQTIDTSSINNGVYFIKIISENETITKKLVKF